MFIIIFAKEDPSKMSDTFLPRNERLLSSCLPVQVMAKRINPKYLKNTMVGKDQPYKNSCSVISYGIVNEQEIWSCPKTVVI